MEMQQEIGKGSTAFRGVWSHLNRLMNFIISEPTDSGHRFTTAINLPLKIPEFGRISNHKLVRDYGFVIWRTKVTS
jgi:hypothetical protein